MKKVHKTNEENTQTNLQINIFKLLYIYLS